MPSKECCPQIIHKFIFEIYDHVLMFSRRFVIVHHLAHYFFFFLYKPLNTHNPTTTSLLQSEAILCSFSSFVILSSENFSYLADMAIRMPRMIQAKQILRRSLSNASNTRASIDIPKGYFAIYVGEQEMKRFVVSVSLLSEPKFQELLHQAENEFGYNHPMGGLTIPCSEDVFSDLASRFKAF